MLDRGKLYKLNIKAGEQQFYQFRTEPGKHYSFISNRELQRTYFGVQPDAPLSMANPTTFNTDFVAYFENYYLGVSSPDTRDYELKFDDYVAPKPMPTPTPTCDTSSGCGVEWAYFSGYVYDDANNLLDNATVTIRSLTQSTSFSNSTRTVNGSYSFARVPYGIQYEMVASKPGFSSRRRIEVSRSNMSGDPNANRYDFGSSGSPAYGIGYNALSDKPEVFHVTPGRNASGVDFKTVFKLNFSEPMDQASVEDNFEIFAFNNKKFTVDTEPATSTVVGSGTVDELTGTRIFDKEAFHISWNGEHTEATFTFKPGLFLPTDRDSSKTPDYQVSLKRADGVIKDKTGASRGANERKFKLTDGDFERSFKFSIRNDEGRPRLVTMDILSSLNPSLVLTFNEPMQIPNLALTLAGGLGGNKAAAPAELPGHITAAQAAENYLLTLKRSGQTLHTRITWSSLGGKAQLDPLDTRRVLLTNASSIAFQSGDEVTIDAASTLLDPAGNSIDPLDTKVSLEVP